MRNKHIIKLSATGSVQQVISMESFGELPISLPSIEVQRTFSSLAWPTITGIARDKNRLELLERQICAHIHLMQASHPEIAYTRFGDLIEQVKYPGHAVSEGIDTRDDINKYPLLRSSRDGKVKWLPTCDITERVIAMGTGGEANVSMYKNFNISKDSLTFKVKDIILDSFLFYTIKSSIEMINEKFFSGTCLKHLLKPRLMEWEVIVPPIEEQRKLEQEFDMAWRMKEFIEHNEIMFEHLMDRFIPRVTVAHIDHDETSAPDDT